MALRDYLRQRFLLLWLPAHIELLKEHMLRKGYAFNVELTK